jgi:hypothetical protein
MELHLKLIHIVALSVCFKILLSSRFLLSSLDLLGYCLLRMVCKALRYLQDSSPLVKMRNVTTSFLEPHFNYTLKVSISVFISSSEPNFMCQLRA